MHQIDESMAWQRIDGEPERVSEADVAANKVQLKVQLSDARTRAFE